MGNRIEFAKLAEFLSFCTGVDINTFNKFSKEEANHAVEHFNKCIDNALDLIQRRNPGSFVDVCGNKNDIKRLYYTYIRNCTINSYIDIEEEIVSAQKEFEADLESGKYKSEYMKRLRGISFIEFSILACSMYKSISTHIESLYLRKTEDICRFFVD